MSAGEPSTLKHRRPPSIFEILLLPLVGIAILVWDLTPENELEAIFIPLVVVAVYLFIAQYQVPRCGGLVETALFHKAKRKCVAWNQVAIFALLFLQISAVAAVSPTVPHTMWIAVAVFYLIYIALRLMSRRYWMIALENCLRLRGL